MLKIHIPSDLSCQLDKKLLFILVRPFYSDVGWIAEKKQLDHWGIDGNHVDLVSDHDRADFILLPYSINHYINNGLYHKLEKYNNLCSKNNIKAFGYIAGDFGQSFPEFENIIYFRMGGFKSQLSKKNIGLPAALSDHHLNLFGSKEISVRRKKIRPKIGFCGYSNSSQIIRTKDSLTYLVENFRRFVRNPCRKDYETIFPSGYYRSQILDDLKKNDSIVTNFKYRKKYRAGVVSESLRKETTIEYYNNIRESDYIFCLRGRGNFSIRFYETLMMGRIPVFINTDCILPLENEIDWRKHVIWINWEDREDIINIIHDFHNSHSASSFEEIQLKNRKLWLEKLQPDWLLGQLPNLLV